MIALRIFAFIGCFSVVKGGIVKLRVDDEVKVYVDGEVVYNEFTMRGWQWEELREIPFSSDNNVLAFRMYNQGSLGLGYGIGEIDGKDLFRSGIVCTAVPEKQDPDALFPGWMEVDYDDSHWKAPVAVESHPTEGIMAEAQGFWAKSKSAKNVLCRLKLTPESYQCPQERLLCEHQCEKVNGTLKCTCNDTPELGTDDNPAVLFKTDGCGDITLLDKCAIQVETRITNGYARCYVRMPANQHDVTVQPNYVLSVDFHLHAFNQSSTNPYHVRVLWNWNNERNFNEIAFFFAYKTCKIEFDNIFGGMFEMTETLPCQYSWFTREWITLNLFVLDGYVQVKVDGVVVAENLNVNELIPFKNVGGMGVFESSSYPLVFRNFKISPLLNA